MAVSAAWRRRALRLLHSLGVEAATTGPGAAVVGRRGRAQVRKLVLFVSRPGSPATGLGLRRSGGARAGVAGGHPGDNAITAWRRWSCGLGVDGRHLSVAPEFTCRGPATRVAPPATASCRVAEQAGVRLRLGGRGLLEQPVKEKPAAA
jgi:hypothetical protein